MNQGTTYILSADAETTIQSVLDTMQPGDVLQLRAGTYHQQIDLSGKREVRIEAYPGDEGLVVISGLTAVDWDWARDPSTGLYTAEYPGFKGLFHWRGDHEGDAFNNRLMYPVLAMLGEEPLLWQPDGAGALREGQFYIDAAPDQPGRIYVNPPDGGAMQKFEISPFDRLLWGDESCEGLALRSLHFKGCSNTGKTGAVCTPGKHWYLEDVTVELANTIGIELGQGGTHMDMRSTTENAMFVQVQALRCGQMGWWGSASHSTLEDCGHEGSNWKGFDHWWEASHKFENCSNSIFIRWSARACRGPGFWFDIGNRDNTIVSPRITRCVRTGLELELDAQNNRVYDVRIEDIYAEVINPDKPWKVAAGVVVKARSNGNEILGGTISGCKEGIRVENQDPRGTSDQNVFRSITFENNRRDVHVIGETLSNRMINL